MYVKNLNEFIIMVGMNNGGTLDEILNKLIDYGFRGDDAIDTNAHYLMTDKQREKAIAETNEVITEAKKAGKDYTNFQDH